MADNDSLNNLIICEERIEEEIQNQKIGVERVYSENINEVNKHRDNLLFKIENLIKQIVVLKERIKKIEKDLKIKKISSNLSRHYEQSRYRKRNS